jgi:hypothetical protein
MSWLWLPISTVYVGIVKTQLTLWHVPIYILHRWHQACIIAVVVNCRKHLYINTIKNSLCNYLQKAIHIHSTADISVKFAGVDSSHGLQVHYSQGCQHCSVTACEVTVLKIHNEKTKDATTNITPLEHATYKKSTLYSMKIWVFSLLAMPEIYKFSKNLGATSKFYV